VKRFFLLLLLFVVACSPVKITTGILDVKDAWARPSVKDGNGAAYFIVENGTEIDDQLMSANSSVASAVELHFTKMEDDHMSMHQQHGVSIPAGEAVQFSPGGLHVMLVGLKDELKVGQTFDIILVFENAGEKKVIVTVMDDLND
jgi:copper(I)-binding protein